ncbi:hypothetical protein GWK26_03550 [haloarchaeon 3A1-DGR]|nr:hypothetical protein GWK26_03550 [haloarchaeon 3A1-DGR]
MTDRGSATDRIPRRWRRLNRGWRRIDWRWRAIRASFLPAGVIAAFDLPIPG